MRILFYFARAYPWQNLIVLLCLMVAATMEGVGLGAVLPVLKVAAADDAGMLPSSGFEAATLAALERVGVPRQLEPLVLVMVGAFAVKAAVLLVANRRVGYMVAHVATDLRLRLLRALLGTTWGFFTRQPLGLAANAMATEATRGARAYEYLAQIVTYGIQATIAISVAIAVSWKVTLAVVGAGLVSIGTLQVFVRMASRAGRRQTTLLKSLLGRLTDILQAVKFLKATAREPLVSPLLERDTRRLNKALQKQVLGKEALLALQEPILVGFCGVGLLVGLRTFGLPVSEVFLLILLFTRTLSSVNKTQRKVQWLVIDESALWSMLHMIEDAEGQREPTGGTKTARLEKAVELRHIDLGYEGRPVLVDASLEIPAGHITAIIGTSGAGKTTLVDLITGLVTPSRGEITVDGTPLPELDLRRWRESIGYVPQELLLLHDSVRVNVTLGDEALGSEDVERALRDAGAWDYVSQLPGGIDASVGERGALLSGGQRQRVAIARALVRRPKLLILDEATAALDPENEAAVWSTVVGLRGRTTIVAISHQPALVGVADRIYRIEDGTAHRIRDPAPLVATEGLA